MRKKLLFVFLGLFLFLGFLIFPIKAEESEEVLKNKIQELENLIKKSRDEQTTLNNQINYMNSQIQLTTLKIAQTEAEIAFLEKQIANLSEKINGLDKALDRISASFLARVVVDYKLRRINPLNLLFSSQDLGQFLSIMKYFRVIQINDRKILFRLEETRQNYDFQKQERDEKQKELTVLQEKLSNQKIALAQQKASLEKLLEVTKNDEKRYQELLAEARREYQALLASKFSEKRHVARGEVIGLMGNTGFSFGAHLHFGVYNLKESEADKFDYFSSVLNPFDYLESKTVLLEGTSCDDVPSAETRTVGTGSWAWPMENPRITQCFGHTPWSFRYRDDFHHGIDIVGRDNIFVSAVEEGEAYFYRGQTSFGNNVRIFHPDGKMTLYLHLQ